MEITFGEPENYSEPNNPFIKGYGFNTSFSFYETSLNEYNSNVQDYFSSTNCSAVDDRYINPLFSPLFDKIAVNDNSTVLRFPGGTISNFYHLGNVSLDKCSTDKKGYGINKNETQYNVPLFYTAWYTKDQLHTRNMIFDLIETIKGQNKPVEVIVVFNVLQHFINSNGTKRNGINNIINATDFNSKREENLNIIRLLKYYNITVKAVEIGNELGWGEYTSSIPWDVNSDEYIEVLKKYKSSLMAEFPDIKIGVPTSQTRYNVVSDWNNKLNQNKQYFDAFVIHRYYQPTNENDGTSSYNFVNNVFVNEMNDFNINYNNNKDKKIWLTEFNLAFNESEEINNDIKNASFLIDFLTMLSNFNKNNSNVIEYPIIHNLAMQSNRFPLINVKGNYQNSNSYCYPNQSLFGAFMYNQLPIFNHFNYYSTTDISSYKIKNISNNNIQNIPKDDFYLKTVYTINNIDNSGYSVSNYAYYANLTNEPIQISAEKISINLQGQNINALNLFNNYGLITIAQVRYITDLEILSQPNIDINSIISTTSIIPVLPNSPFSVLPANSIGIISLQFTCPYCRIGYNNNFRIKNEADIDLKQEFLIYPNPSGNTISFKNVNDKYKILIYNSLGEIIKEQFIDNTNSIIYVLDLSNGIYNYNIYKENQLVYSNKFTVLH